MEGQSLNHWTAWEVHDYSESLAFFFLILAALGQDISSPTKDKIHIFIWNIESNCQLLQKANQDFYRDCVESGNQLREYCHLKNSKSPIHVYRCFFYLFKYSLICFNNILWFSMWKSDISFVKFILHVLFFVILNATFS